MRGHLASVVVLAIMGMFANMPVRAGDQSFIQSVAPILKQRCIQCHDAKKRRGGLDLTNREALVQGGEHGPVIVPGNAGKSRLVEMISGPKPRMPKQGGPLSRQQIASIRQWIDQGALWPKSAQLVKSAKEPKSRRDWWSLRLLVRPAVPAVRDAGWVQTPIDAFILAALEAKGLKPSPPADKATLIRRVTYDLIGLPPTPAEIDAFLNDPQPDAYEKLVDRLLASPRYGERWGRHWLDEVHYGDTHGYDKDKRRNNAWPYRDYVIRSFNQDKPYSRFIREQLAGDVLYPGEPDGIIGTGFIAAGPWDFVGHVELREGTADKKKARLIDRDDMLANTMSTFVSLSAQCARCHNHKFDPIPQKDYYRLQAVFAGVDRGDRPYDDPPGAGLRRRLEARRKALAYKRELLFKSAAQVTSRELVPQDGKRRELSDQLANVEADLASMQKQIASLPTPHMVYAVVSHKPRPIYLLRRGNVENPGELVAAGTLSVVPGLDADFRLPQPNDEGNRRAALAQWLASPKNVLTWRSIVNRIWQHHFGCGMVDTPNDFGRNGSLPTHPKLLDWLAVEFRDGGQSIKKLHRWICLSAVYRQSSRENAAYAKVDSENRLLWRMNRRRLEAEAIRDAVLAISGKLNSQMGGPGFELFAFKDDHSPVYDHSIGDKLDDPRYWRRTIYRFIVRSVPNPFLECLDCADPNINTPVRSTTITALQALALLNDPFIVRQAEYLAERLKKESNHRARQIDMAYRLTFGRLPRPGERDALVQYVKKHGLANACRLLLNTNEFIFID